MLMADQRRLAFEEWVNERKEETDIEIYEDALWASIDMDKYATNDSTAANE